MIIDAADIAPQVSQTNLAQVMPIDGVIPGPDDFDDPNLNTAARLEYMDFEAGTPIKDIRVTPSSSAAARTAGSRICERGRRRQGRKVADGMRTLVVPAPAWSSSRPKPRACRRSSAVADRSRGARCLAMNPDKLQPGERCASTSNRNFEGRQGRGGRTHLSPPPSPPRHRRVLCAARRFGLNTTTRQRTHHAGSTTTKAVRIVQGTAATDRTDVDTDQIIPFDWLKRAEGTGFEKGLLEWRDDRTSCSTRSSTPAPTSSSA